MVWGIWQNLVYIGQKGDFIIIMVYFFYCTNIEIYQTVEIKDHFANMVHKKKSFRMVLFKVKLSGQLSGHHDPQT